MLHHGVAASTTPECQIVNSGNKLQNDVVKIYIDKSTLSFYVISNVGQTYTCTLYISAPLKWDLNRLILTQ